MKIGYARVSSNGQNHDGQVEALKAAGCKKVYSEKRSGKSTNGRHKFERLMKAIKSGDTVVVTKLDRLARSSRDLANILNELAEKGCGFTSLAESWCDTTSSVGRLSEVVEHGWAHGRAANSAHTITANDLMRSFWCPGFSAPKK